MRFCISIDQRILFWVLAAATYRAYLENEKETRKIYLENDKLERERETS